VTAHFRIISNC